MLPIAYCAECYKATGARLLTAVEVAAELGLERTRIHQLSRQHGIGLPAGPRNTRLYTPAMVETLRTIRRPGGRPVTTTITARSRNLGISWSNEPERVWNADRSNSWLSIRTPEPPKACNLGVAGVLREAAEIARKNSGNEYSLALWVGGQRIARPREVLAALRDEFDPHLAAYLRDRDGVMPAPTVTVELAP